MRLLKSAPVAACCTGMVLLAASQCHAQVVNPATQQPSPTENTARPTDVHHTWEMPPVDVIGKAPLVEEERIGDYAQPRWTTHRRFGETRVYVIPRGMTDFEYWLIPNTPKDGGATDFKTQYEVEFGLPGRFQLDLYAVGHKEGTKDEGFAISEQKVELRWALADWGKIWGNPTVYVEWNEVSNAPDHLETKLLLGGQITSRWHWGSNLVWEHEVSGPQENSNEWTTGVSYSARDSRFGVGFETQLALVNAIDPVTLRRGDFATEFLVGPSLQFRPLPQLHIDVAPLFGVTADASRAKTFIVLGWEF
jgi:hypothetical protein